MERQCAWCLCFINCFGEPISAPQPKRYEVSHGMCRACGSLWLERATGNTVPREIPKPRPAVHEVVAEEEA